MQKLHRFVVLTLIAIVAVSTMGAVFVYMQMQTSSNPFHKLKVACVGDSITANFGYPEALQTALGENYNVSNFGLGGTTINLDSETPYIHEPIFNGAKNSQPDIVVIMLGTNDAHPWLQQYIGNFINDYNTLIAELQKLPSRPQIWIVKPPPIYGDGTGLSSDFLRQSILPRIEEVAQKAGCPLIDANTPLQGKPELFVDGVHPTFEGAMLIADEVYKAISPK